MDTRGVPNNAQLLQNILTSRHVIDTRFKDGDSAVGAFGRRAMSPSALE